MPTQVAIGGWFAAVAGVYVLRISRKQNPALLLLAVAEAGFVPLCVSFWSHRAAPFGTCVAVNLSTVAWVSIDRRRCLGHDLEKIGWEVVEICRARPRAAPIAALRCGISASLFCL